MPNATEAQIKTRIAEFIQELDLLVRKNTLDSLIGILEGGEVPARRGRPAGPGRSRGSGRGGNVDEAAAKIVAYVRSNDGQGISAIANGTGVVLPLAKKAAIKLLAEGALKKSGQKRGTVYHVGSGRAAPARAKKAGRRRARKAKRKATKAKRKPTARKATKAKRMPRAKAKRVAPRAAKKVVVIPARRRPAVPPRVAAGSPKATTDVPQSLAVAE